MKLSNANASIFMPDGKPLEQACARVTHLGIGAHPDDLEVMAYHGILTCYRDPAKAFGGIICTDGGGSPRIGEYADHNDKDFKSLRRHEQEEAAVLGHYAVVFQLGYSSADARGSSRDNLQSDACQILAATRPDVVYTHNPADKHETHVAVAMCALRAMRTLPKAERPSAVYGCEVWRDLDWLPDEDKVKFDVSARENLAHALIGVYDSQIGGGKRYDLAAIGRRRAHATFLDPHTPDQAAQLIFAMDLTPLVRDDTLDIADYVGDVLNRFRDDVLGKLKKYNS